MSRALRTWLLLATLLSVPARGFAVSTVFDGDPTDPATGLPYEIMPGFPLVLPGPDGVLGTGDDVVNASVIGDIDMVVRSGSPVATTTIPPPTVVGGIAAVPVGVAGSAGGGGSEILFTVFLSDGVTGADAPSGHPLNSADMDGIPVVVSAFADLDGDGFIGPTDRDARGASDNSFEVRELEPVGRAAALFSGGVASGRLAISAGLPASRHGLRVALAAMAVTGPLDPNFYGGSIPSGPAISTALPFLPQRDLNRLIRDRAVAVGPNTTLQQVIAFAALPAPSGAASFALPLDGSSPTIDVAVVHSQPAVRAAFGENLPEATHREMNDEIVFGNASPAYYHWLRLLPVDRWANPADPDAAFIVTLEATPPLRILRPARSRARSGIRLRSAQGIPVCLKIPPGTADGTSGTLTAEHDGVVVAALNYRVDTRANRRRADVTVPNNSLPTIQAAINGVSDRNHDGALVIDVKPGIYRENLVINRSVALHGRGAGATMVQGDGGATVVTVAAPNVTVSGLTAIGGGTGFGLDASSALVTESRAWRNVGNGVSASAAGARVWRADSVDNGGDGVFVGAASGATCSETNLIDNHGMGANLSGAQNAQLDNNLIADNGAGGVSLSAVTSTVVSDNRIANNVGAGGDNQGSGIALLASQNNQIVGNLCALNDDNGMLMDQTSGNLVAGNTFADNNGYGLFVRRSTDDDFAAGAGVQDALGDNSSSNNRKGDLLVKTK